VISIRDATAPDIAAIEAVRRASWRAAYAGLIAQAFLDRATSGSSAPPQLPSWRRTLVAVPDDGPAVVGYASFGPERAVHSYVVPAAVATGNLPRFTDAGSAGQVGELYALYLDPAYWSTGTGRVLMDTAVSRLTAAGYEKAVLWVLGANARARRFYEIAGWKPDGTDSPLPSLGGVIETRYTRPLALRLTRSGQAGAQRRGELWYPVMNLRAAGGLRHGDGDPALRSGLEERAGGRHRRVARGVAPGGAAGPADVEHQPVAVTASHPVRGALRWAGGLASPARRSCRCRSPGSPGTFQQREADQGRPVIMLVTSRTAVADRVRYPVGTMALRLEPFRDEQIANWPRTWNACNEQQIMARGQGPSGPGGVPVPRGRPSP
jgi:GNAT superfamily N-acetyltransferase